MEVVRLIFLRIMKSFSPGINANLSGCRRSTFALCRRSFSPAFGENAALPAAGSPLFRAVALTRRRRQSPAPGSDRDSGPFPAFLNGEWQMVEGGGDEGASVLSDESQGSAAGSARGPTSGRVIPHPYIGRNQEVAGSGHYTHYLKKNIFPSAPRGGQNVSSAASAS